MNALKVSGICKRYPSFVLEDVSFTLPAGTIMGLIGVNGAGKTTTLKAILGHLRTEAGSIELFDKPFAPDALAGRTEIGYVSGGADYFPRKKLKAITDATRGFFPDWDEEIYRTLLRRFRLDEQKRVCELSAGMKVKYQLALALSHHARLLILDEPTSGLDPVSRDELLELFLTLRDEQGVSVLFSTHITSDLEKCAQYITYLQNGRVLLTGERRALLARYLVVSAPTPTEEQCGLLLGLKRHPEQVSGLLPVEYRDRFAPELCAPATLEDMMVYLEREAVR